MVKTRLFKLRGLAEGIAGRSSVQAKNAADVFIKIPALVAVQSKLSVNGNTITGFRPCDG